MTGAVDPGPGLPEPPAATGPGLFGEEPAPLVAPAARPGPYRVLARAYRPTRFDELIGQDAMVRILRRAFALDRVAHAFMLTGVRGVGKTTTARIIARALNCVGADGRGGPTVDPCGVCPNCTAILADRHPDVLEMDAATRTGIDDVREIIEATRYRPIQARMKVFIVDEVHMLSKPAFNALLKTLEEPPSQVTFIFATTELRRVPVTVLSRCQRFDLRRVSMTELAELFGRIAAREGAVVEPDALALIARAADGSVRDGLSLLDQAIALGGQDDTDRDDTDRAIRAARVADMLGLADRGLVFDLAEAVFGGRTAEALAVTDQAHERGADLGVMLADLLELVHTVSRLKAIPALRDSAELPEFERVRGAALAETLGVPVLGRAWQMLLKGVAEVDGAPDRREAAEMVLIRLCHVADLPTPGELVRQIQAQGPGAAVVASAPPAAPPGPGSGSGPGSGLVQAARHAAGSALRALVPERSPERSPEPEHSPEPSPGPVAEAVPEPAAPPVAPGPPLLRSWREVVAFVKEQAQPLLHGELMSLAHPVRVRPGLIELRLKPEAPKTLTQRLRVLLSEATGAVWSIVVSGEPGEPTLAEQAGQVSTELERDAASHPLVRAILTAFPGARLGPVEDRTLDPYYQLRPERGLDAPPPAATSLLGEAEAPDMEFAPDDSEPVGLDDLV